MRGAPRPRCTACLAAKPRFQKLPDRGSRHGSGLSCFFKPTLKQYHRWNGGNAEALRQARQFFRVHFDHDPLPDTLGSDFPQFWLDHLARAAPRRPEIDQNGNGGAVGHGVEN